MDRVDCQATVSRAAESDMTERLTFSFFCLLLISMTPSA